MVSFAPGTANKPSWRAQRSWRRILLQFDDDGFAYVHLRGVQRGWFVIVRIAQDREGRLCAAGIVSGGERDSDRLGLDPETEPALAWQRLHDRAQRRCGRPQ